MALTKTQASESMPAVICRKRIPGTDHPGPVTIQFIVATTLDKTDADTRKLIRSHVMRGKNKGKTRPKKATKAPKRVNLSSPESSSPNSDSAHEHSGSSPDVTDQSLWVAPRPRMVAGDLDLFAVTSGLPPSLKDLISKGVCVPLSPTDPPPPSN